MAQRVKLARLGHDDPEVERILESWATCIELAHTHEVGGHVNFDFSPGTGYVWFFPNSTGGTISGIVQSGGITASPSEGTLGSGNVKLKIRTTGATVIDGPILVCYSRFKVAVPAGTWVEVSPDREALKLIGADCPIT